MSDLEPLADTLARLKADSEARERARADALCSKNPVAPVTASMSADRGTFTPDRDDPDDPHHNEYVRQDLERQQRSLDAQTAMLAGSGAVYARAALDVVEAERLSTSAVLQAARAHRIADYESALASKAAEPSCPSCSRAPALRGTRGYGVVDPGGVEPKPPPYPGRRPPPPLSKPAPPVRSPENLAGYQRGVVDVEKGFRAPDGVWDQETLANNTKLRDTLERFDAGEVGASGKEIPVAGKSPEEIHEDLTGAGFQYHREPLFAARDPEGNVLYRLRDGTTTPSSDDPEIVPHDIYTHDDGTMVRVKPEGDPGGRRPVPHVSKSVVDPPHQTGWDNEIFKITDDGDPVPKAPQKAYGAVSQPASSQGQDYNVGYADGVMGAAHVDLGANINAIGPPIQFGASGSDKEQ